MIPPTRPAFCPARKFTAAAALPFVALLAASCGNSFNDTGDAETRAFTHSQGVTEIPVEPQRIVTTTDQNALLPLLELGITPVGSAGIELDGGQIRFRRTDGYDTTSVEPVGPYGAPNLEKIAALNPDVIVGYEYDSDMYDDLSAIAPTVLIQVFDRPLDDALLDFADLAGETDRAEEMQADFRARVDDFLDKLGDRKDTLSISLISQYEPGQFNRVDIGQATGTVMQALDLLRPAPQQGPGDFEDYSIETLGQHDADVVLVFDYSDDEGQRADNPLYNSPVFAELAATKAGQAYVIDGATTVGAAWGKMIAFLDELERILLAEDLRTDVVIEN
ncbi:ABC transporter substrate-binding protein [Hoyosella subflava]|uniref:Iron(III) dicitrate-binding periplasmic protein n=1 Tax=Hoyosella subflava (strain DSM 45089 / JCM 17490 / NBRC 109087 / DQS3-9A1) TaxID=443218 RepID=F6ELQ9_HOYSD|nr:iron-siderophore ABC transporter substrate-binding protein [Hoyosella subflava]AEF41507.1 Iron(III) dicitrate-binding periplasmic protein [Hoyosella subflava DQS3-9A1]